MNCHGSSRYPSDTANAVDAASGAYATTNDTPVRRACEESRASSDMSEVCSQPCAKAVAISMGIQSDISSRPQNLASTHILDCANPAIRELAETLSAESAGPLEFVRTAHLRLVELLRPVY